MSTTIDQRVVEMRFDNKNFESNVSTTMSTLDKLKQKLNFTGASKGLENVSASAKKVDMTGLANGVETVRAKFSALEVMGVTALANITNSAVNAGKRILSALTIEPITTGFNEYELKMNSIQTIMASTGEDINTVNRYLQELNEYSDQTIYSFSDMTSNIGKFTNAGVKLEDAVMAIKGISNEAAVSGANANEASRAMYNFAQALSSGYVKLIDWKSIELANMATVEFKEQLMETALQMGTIVKVGDKYKSTTTDMAGKASEAFTATSAFNESLSAQWMTTDVLIGTLSKYADTSTEIGKKASRAATEVKTVTQLWGVLKETAQSGWAQTWELIVGDLEEAKSFLTMVSDGIGGVIDSMSKWRNNLVAGAVTSKWDKFAKKIEAAGLKTEDFLSSVEEVAKKNGLAVDHLIDKHGSLQGAIAAGKIPAGVLTKALKKLIGAEDKLDEATGKATKSMEEYEKIVTRVIDGEFGSGQARWDKLTEAGYDWAKVQNMVNERLGVSARHMETLTNEQLKNADSLAKLSDEQLKSKGYTDEQIKALRDLKKAAEEGGTSINELLEDIAKPSGRDLLVESFKNLGDAISKPFKAIREAFDSVFGDVNGSDVLYRMIEGFKELTESMVITDETANRLKTIFEGLFYGWKMSWGIMGTSLNALLKLTSTVLGLFGTDLMGVAEILSNYIIKFAKWLDEHTLFIDMMDKVAKIIHSVIVGVHDCLKAFLSLSVIKDIFKTISDAVVGFFGKIGKGLDGVGIDGFVERVNKFFADVKSWILSLEGSENFWGDFFGGIGKAIKGAASGIKTFFSSIFNSFYASLGDNSIIKIVIDGILECVDAIRSLSVAEGLISRVSKSISGFFERLKGAFSGLNIGVDTSKIESFFKNIAEWIRSLEGSENLAKDIITGLVNGLTSGVKAVASAIINIAKTLITSFCEVLGIHSPSTEFMEAAGHVVDGIVVGLKNGASKIWNTVTGIFNSLVDFVQKIDFGAVLAAGIGVGMLSITNKFVNIIDKMVSPLPALSGMFKSVGEFFTDLGKNIKGWLNAKKMMLWAEGLKSVAIAIGILVASVYVLSKIDSESMATALVALGTIAAIIGVLAFAASKMGSVADIGKMSLMVLAISGAILIMSFAISKLAKIDVEAVPNVLATLTGIMVSMGFLIGAIGYLVNPMKEMNLHKVGSMLIKMSAALLLMVYVIKLASKLEGGEIIKGVAVVALLELLFIGMVRVAKSSDENAAKVGSMLLRMAGSLLIMVGVIKLCSILKADEIVKGLAVISLVSLLFVAIIKVAKYAGENTAKAGSMMLMMSIALGVAVEVIKKASELDGEAIKKGLTVIASLELLFAGIIFVSKYAGENAVKAGSMLMLMAGALLMITGVLFILSHIDSSGLYRALGVVTVLELLFMGLIASTKYAKDCKSTLIVMVVAIGILSAAVVGLSFIDPKNLWNATGAISAVLGIFALLVASTKYAKNSKAMLKTLWSLVAITAVLAGIIVGLSFVDSTNVLPNIASLSLLMMSLTGCLLLMGKAGTISTTVSKQLWPMLGVVAALALIVAGLSFVDPKAVLTSTAAITILMLSLTSCLLIMGKAGKISTTVSKQLVPMLGVVAGLALIIAGLSFIPNPDTAIKMTGALVALLFAFTAVTAVLSVIGKGNVVASASKGAAALASVIGIISGTVILLGSLIGLIGNDWMSKIDSGLDRFIDMMTKMGPMLLAFIPVTAALGLIGALLGPASAAIGAAALVTVIGIIGATAVAIGTLMGLFTDSFFTKIENGLDRFTSVMIKIGEAIGGFVGGVFGGIAEGVLAGVGNGLSAFMNNAQEFIEGCRGIDDSVSEGAGTLAKAILMLTGAGALEAFVDAFDLGPSLPNLGSDLSAFMGNAKEFIDGASRIDPAMMEGVKTLSEAILTLTGANILDGLARFFSMGSSSLATFGEQLPLLGAGISGFATNLGGFEGKGAIVTQAASAIKTLAQAASDIPNIGGLLASIVGDNDLSTWASQLPNVGKGISGFITNIGDFDEGKVTIAKYAADVIKVLAGAASEIPNMGGWLAAIVGDNDLSTWASQLPNVAIGISGFIENLGEFDEGKVEIAKSAAGVISTLAKASSEIPNVGGWLAAIVGDNDLTTFASQLPEVGKGLNGFITNIDGIDEGSVETAKYAAQMITELAKTSQTIDAQSGLSKSIFGDNSIGAFSEQFANLGANIAKFVDNLGAFNAEQLASVRQAVSAIRAFATLADSNLMVAKTSLGAFGNLLPGLGANIASFCDKIPAANVIETAKTNINEIVNLIKDISVIDSNIVDGFINSLKTLGSNGIKAFIDAFTNNTTSTDVKNAAITLTDKLIDAIETKEKDVKSAFDDLSEAGVDGVESRSNYNDFKSAGKYLGDGLVEGIEAKEQAVYNAAYTLGRIAVQGEKDGQASNSPSKLTIKAGKWLGEGLVIGMAQMANRVYKSGSSLGETATSTISSTIGALSDMVNTDIDSQPTIRPVLDLTDISSGLNTMTSMFDTNSSVGVLANVGAVSTMMNRHGQNGGNTDVVSAIDRLRDDFNNNDRTTYNINGITYDDGSNLRDAIETIIRFANIERRV